MLVETNFAEMSDEELRMCALRFTALFNQTGREEYSRLADEADELRMRRMLSAPNPYAKGAANMCEVKIERRPLPPMVRARRRAERALIMRAAERWKLEHCQNAVIRQFNLARAEANNPGHGMGRAV